MNISSKVDIFLSTWMHDVSTQLVSGAILAIPTLLFFAIRFFVQINDDVQLDVIEPKDEKGLKIWEVKSVGRKGLYITEVVGYQQKVTSDRLDPGQSISLSSLWGSEGGVIYYKRYKWIRREKSAVYGNGILYGRKRKRVQENPVSPRSTAKALKSYRKSSNTEFFVIEGSMSKVSSYKSFFISRDDQTKVPAFTQIKEDVPLSYLKIIFKKRLINRAVILEDESYWNVRIPVSWYTLKLIEDDLRQLGSRNFKSLTSPNTATSFLNQVSSDNREFSRTLLEILRYKRAEREIVYPQVQDGQKVVRIADLRRSGVELTIYSANSLKQEHRGLLFSVTEPLLSLGEGTPISKQHYHVFLGQSGHLIIENVETKSLEGVRLSEEDTNKLWHHLTEWKSWN